MFNSCSIKGPQLQYLCSCLKLIMRAHVPSYPYDELYIVYSPLSKPAMKSSYVTVESSSTTAGWCFFSVVLTIFVNKKDTWLISIRFRLLVSIDIYFLLLQSISILRWIYWCTDTLIINVLIKSARIICSRTLARWWRRDWVDHMEVR